MDVSRVLAMTRKCNSFVDWKPFDQSNADQGMSTDSRVARNAIAAMVLEKKLCEGVRLTKIDTTCEYSRKGIRERAMRYPVPYVLVREGPVMTIPARKRLASAV
jgi:hypothetical protein